MKNNTDQQEGLIVDVASLNASDPVARRQVPHIANLFGLPEGVGIQKFASVASLISDIDLKTIRYILSTHAVVNAFDIYSFFWQQIQI